MTALSLYQLTGQWLTLAHKLSDMDLDAATIADTIEGSDEQTAIEEKLQGYEMVARTIEMPISAIDAEIARLQALRKSRLERADLLRTRMLGAMQAMGIERISCPLFEIKRQTNPASVVIFEEALIPAGFVKTKTTESIDKAAIKAAIKAGEDVPGAKLESTERLVVK